MSHQLAQINIARLVAPIDDPKIAASSPNWTPSTPWRRPRPASSGGCNPLAGNATDIAYNDDPFVIVNMSVWQSVESLRDYVYNSGHVAVFRDRAMWFEKMSLPNYCLWWVPEGHVPTVAEGRERLEHYQTHGATPRSFWFKKQFPAPAEPVPALQC